MGGLPAASADAVATQPVCLSQTAETARIRHVHDGDTVILDNGAKVRLIGINTPELARDSQPAETGALNARDTLRAWIRMSDTLQLRYGRQRRDHYGRLLAHLYADGRNLQAALLEAGLATPLYIAPNLGHLECYRQASATAREARRGLWALEQYQPRSAASLTGRERGYHIISGTVQRVGRSRSSIWLDLTPSVALRIVRNDLALFDGSDFDDWVGHRLEAHGYLYQRNNQLRMRIRHPADLRILD